MPDEQSLTLTIDAEEIRTVVNEEIKRHLEEQPEFVTIEEFESTVSELESILDGLENIDSGNGNGNGNGNSSTGDYEERIETALDELDTLIASMEERLGEPVSKAKTFGPSVDVLNDLPANHPHPGWGIQFTSENAFTIEEATFKAGESGEIRVELHGYDSESGNTTDVVDATSVGVEEGVQTVELDLSADVGEYLLTRDWENTPNQPSVPLARHQYGGWDGDAGDGIDLIGGAHDEFDSNDYWYYFYDLTIATETPSNGTTGSASSSDTA